MSLLLGLIIGLAALSINQPAIEQGDKKEKINIEKQVIKEIKK